MKTDHELYSEGLGEQLKEIAEGPLTEVAEVGLDALLNEGVLKNLPVISIANGIFKAGVAARRQLLIDSLGQFISGMNAGIVNEARKEELRHKLFADSKQTEEELEYILIYIDKSLEEDKPRLLAAFYLAYLDGLLDWQDFTECSKIIDDLFIRDILMLKQTRFDRSDVHQRLVSKGLVKSEAGQHHDKLTRFGNKFLRCLLSYPEIIKPIETKRHKKEMSRENKNRAKRQ